MVSEVKENTSGLHNCRFHWVSTLECTEVCRTAIISRLAEPLAWEALVVKDSFPADARSGTSAGGLHERLAKIACKGIRNFLNGKSGPSRRQPHNSNGDKVKQQVKLEDVLSCVQKKYVQRGNNATVDPTKAMKGALRKHVHGFEMIALVAAVRLRPLLQQQQQQLDSQNGLPAPSVTSANTVT